MRRIGLTALLFLTLASCGYRAVYVDRPVIQPSIGSVPPRLGQIKGNQVMVCREVGRSRCDRQTCKASSMDLVTLNCSGARVSRCELGTGGC